MTAIIYFGLLILLLFAIAKISKPMKKNTDPNHNNSDAEDLTIPLPQFNFEVDEDITKKKLEDNTTKQDLKNNLLKNIFSIENKKNVPAMTSNITDNSIIDVTEQTCKIEYDTKVSTDNRSVPKWSHTYVYSYDEINNASYAQKEFYNYFKKAFLNGEYLDLEDNTNYAFILLFDLLNEYDIHQDIGILENQYKLMGDYYPNTKSYGVSFLIKKMEALGDNENASRLRSAYNHNDYNYDWRLGSKYKTKLKLNEDEVQLLNKLWYPFNNFCNIEYCCLEIMKLYLAVVADLKTHFIKEGSAMESQFELVADVIARKYYRYKSGSTNYKYCLESTVNELYVHIFKLCENAVREHYDHKRKINVDTPYNKIEEYNIKFLLNVNEIIDTLISSVSPPDVATEIELYSQSTNRWKNKFQELTTNFNEKTADFVNSIIALGKLNIKNPAIENIFYEASKFISKTDREAALSLYMYYLYYDLKSTKFDNKQLTKTIQKNLFKTNDQLHNFEILVSELIQDRNLEKALSGISKVFEIKRKKIQLDSDSIEQVKQQHSGTVSLLNEYLKEEYEDENNTITAQQVSNEEIQIEIKYKNVELMQSLFIPEIQFTEIHTSALELFAKNNFTVTQGDLDIFARSKGIFKNQLIESINDKCYDYLDDILIEEDDDYYIINTNYYQKISA